MAQFSPKARLGGLSRSAGLRMLTREVAALLVIWRRRAQTRPSLDELDDHMLRDIGLTREAAQTERAKPFWR
ncbi:MAG: DUF1127 domain-containing protein [Pseudomonadota bacterium]